MRLRRRPKKSAYFLTIQMNRAQDRKLVKPTYNSIKAAVGALEVSGMLTHPVTCRLDAQPQYPKGQIGFSLDRVSE